MSAFESLRKNDEYSKRQAAGCHNGRTEENLRGPVAACHRTWQNNPASSNLRQSSCHAPFVERGHLIRHALRRRGSVASASTRLLHRPGHCLNCSSSRGNILAFALTEHHLRRHPPSDSSPPSKAGARKFQISEMSIFESLRKK